MIAADNLLKIFKKNNINFFTGVPDSILKNFSIEIENYSNQKHVIATSEGAAVSLGIGYYLSTKKLPCIYLQNSGLGNAINPLISIASKAVYSIPLLLLVGWRGSPRNKDEPQHQAKGKITKKLLNLLKIKNCVLRNDNDLIKIKKLIKYAKKNKSIVACLIEKNTLIANKKKIKKDDKRAILRSDFIKKFLSLIPKSSKIISTTGYTSRELMELRNVSKIKKGKDFYMVGGMGHSSSVALGYALQSKKEVFCLDGDGSILMHLGALRTVGHLKNKNFKHIILNNNSHESVGGQPTYASAIDFKNLVRSIGYKKYFKISRTNKNPSTIIKSFINHKGPSLLEVKIKNKSIKNLSRPKNLHLIKERFMSS